MGVYLPIPPGGTLFLLTEQRQAVAVIAEDGAWEIRAMRPWPGHGTLVLLQRRDTMEAEGELERLAAQGLGVPVYMRPAPDESVPVNVGYVPQTGADLLTFEAMVDHMLAEVASPEALAMVREELIELHAAKAVMYQNAAEVESCFLRGLYGLFHNIMRKADRVETVGIRLGVSAGNRAALAEAAADGERGADAETLYRTVRDLVVYGINTLRWLQGERKHGQSHDSR